MAQLPLVLVYHGPLQIATWLRVAPSTFTRVYIDGMDLKICSKQCRFGSCNSCDNKKNKHGFGSLDGMAGIALFRLFVYRQVYLICVLNY